MWEKLGKKVKESVGLRYNEVDIEMEEHVVSSNSETVTVDKAGNDVKFDYEISNTNIEPYPDQVLEINKEHVDHPKISFDEILDMLKKNMVNHEDVKIVAEKFLVVRKNIAYVPFYEVRLEGSKNSIKIKKINGVTKKEF